MILIKILCVLLAMLGQPNGNVPASPAPDSKEAAVSNDMPLRLGVVTFNIRYGTADDKENAWPKRKEQVFAILRDEHVEVFGLQEALRMQLDEIHAACPKLGEIGVGREDGKTKGEYSAILYRTDKLKPVKSGTFWLSEKPEEPGSKSWKTACTRVCTWARFEEMNAKEGRSPRAVWVFNTHMDHVSAEARLNGAKLIAKRIAERGDSTPFVVTGDFNSDEGHPAARYFTAPPMEGDGKSPIGVMLDTFRMVNPEAKDCCTFHGFHPTKQEGEKIDYILVQPGAMAISAWIDRRHVDGPPMVSPSDHYPVGAIVDLPVASAPVDAKSKQ
jgi:endonuclease/exonuclease/phosphatase family metal-dependent hydrolase